MRKNMFMGKILLTKMIVLSIVGTLVIQTTVPKKAHGAAMFVGMASGNPVLALLGLFAGIPLTGKALLDIYESLDKGTPLRATTFFYLVAGLLALSADTNAYELQEIAVENSSDLGVTKQDIETFNAERMSLNVFNETVQKEIVGSRGALSPQREEQVKADYEASFSASTRAVAKAMSLRIINSQKR